MSNIQDPFEDVVCDTEEQVTRLEQFLEQHHKYTTEAEMKEVREIVDDVAETLEDLDKSIAIVAKTQNNTVDVAGRRHRLSQLEEKFLKLKTQFNSSELGTSAKTSHIDDVNVTVDLEENNPNDVNITGGASNPFQEQMLREQDTHLDDIHQTMKNLHLQAETMGQELEDQGQLLSDMDQGMDTVAGKLARGRRQLEWVYEKNKERYNDCCIMLLIIALIVLLVLAFIV
uniref:t-SNARE affecting a late Golgi compartment protein 1 n=1 Tax=Nakaseomyces delphensis TaxID=51657 RepID=A7WPH5_NAKDE|nr:t-SNARE [Nakaseomyces delphensis]